MFRMSLSSALLRRFAIRSTTGWLSHVIQTFLGDSSVWVICNTILAPSLWLERTCTMCRPVWHVGVAAVVVVVVELPLTPEYDLRSARAACKMQTSYSQLVHRCSQS